MIDRRRFSSPLELYANALLAEKFYTSSIFAGKKKEDVDYCNLCKDLRNNPKTSWDATVAQYPGLALAVEEVREQMQAIVSGYDFSYWQLLDVIVWTIDEDPDEWKQIIADYKEDFLVAAVH